MDSVLRRPPSGLTRWQAKNYAVPAPLQVFRTYNASVTLDRLLWSNEDGLPGDGIAREGTVELKKASYDRANKEVSGRLAAVPPWQVGAPNCPDSRESRMDTGRFPGPAFRCAAKAASSHWSCLDASSAPGSRAYDRPTPLACQPAIIMNDYR